MYERPISGDVPELRRSALFSYRQSKIEGRAVIGFGLRPDTAAMTGNNSLNGRQADPAAFEFIGGMQALKGAEKLLRMLHVEADTVVPDGINVFTGSLFVTDVDSWLFATSCEFDRIRQQILKHLGNESFIPVCSR